GEPREHRLGHLLERLVFEMVDVAAARAAAHRADERGDGARLVARRLRDRRAEVERLVADAEGSARHRRDQRDLVAVGERAGALRVLAVDRVEQAVRLVAEVEPAPDVADARDVLELDSAGAGALAQAGEEANRDAHALSVPDG